MDLQTIDKLLERYWNADTSPEEEEVLRKYFSENEVPEHLRGVASLFRQYQADRQFKTLDAAFETEVLEEISRAAFRKPKIHFEWQPLLRIAAVLMIFLLTALLLKQHLLVQDTQQVVVEHTEDTYEDPQQAYEQTRQALLLVSSLMNEGTQHIEKLETFSEAQETIKAQKQ